MFSKSWRAIKKHASREGPKRADSDDTAFLSQNSSESSTTFAVSDVADGGEFKSQSSAASASSFFRRRRDGARDRRLDPLGLTAIYTPPSTPSVDIIFVHGLGGSSRLTWCKNQDLELFWPLKWLPLEEDVSSARILTFGYDSLFKSRQRNGVQRIEDFARTLLYCMRNPPKEVDALLPLGNCPIIFVMHSMGGLVFKKAYLMGEHDSDYKHIIHAIRAAVFLATPHRGTHLAEYLNKLLRVSMVYSSRDYISEMNYGGSFLREVNDGFRTATTRLQMYSFYETFETDVGPRRMMVVDRDSAVFGYAGERFFPLAADHHSVCKFESPVDINYITVATAIRTLAAYHRHEGDENARKQLDREMEIVSEYLSVSQSDGDDDFYDFCSRQSPGTCDWILNTPQLQSWEDANPESSVLWLHAHPGRGKSVLSAYLIRHLLERKAAVQYFFFRFGEQLKRSTGALFASLSIQLARHFPKYRKALLRLKNINFNPRDSARRNNPWPEFLRRSLYSLDLATPLYWVIDGVDEADVPESVFDVLQSINSSTTPIRVLLVSRWSTSLSVAFERLKLKVPSSTMCVDNSSADIHAYLELELSLLSWSPEIKEEVLQKVSRQANGSFLWVHLAMEEIKNCVTMESVETVLDELPDGMEAFYARMVTIIRPTERKKRSDTDLQRFLFIWAIYSTTAISLSEMRMALKLKSEWKLMSDLQGTIVSLCGHFLVFEGNDRIRLIHETARDYLRTRATFKDDFEPYQAHHDIFEHSILAFKSSDPLLPQLSDDEDDECLMVFEYRATSWAYHLSHISDTRHSERALGLLVDFFSGLGVINWIRVVAGLRKLNTLIETSRRLSNFTQRLRKVDGPKSPPYPILTDIELLQLWARDLLKLVAKFGSVLLQEPTAVFHCIPSFCPRGSGIFRSAQNVLLPSIAVSGQSEDWDDCLSRVSVGGGHRALMLACSWKYLAVLNDSGASSMWDCLTFEELHKVPHQEKVNRICFSYNGNFFASYGKLTTKIWNAETGELICCISNIPRSRALDFCFTENDSRLLVALDDHRVLSTSVDAKQSNSEWHQTTIEHGNYDLGELAPNSPAAVTFSPDRTKVAATYRRFPLTVWSIKSPRMPMRLKTKNSSVGVLDDSSIIFAVLMDWHPNSEEVMVVTLDGSILKWDVVTKNQWELEKPKTMPSSIQCSPDGLTFATADRRGTIKLYDYHTFAQLYQLELSSQQMVKMLRFSLDSRRFYDIRGDYCNVWEPNILVGLSNTHDHLSDTQNEYGGIAQSNLHSEVFEDNVAPISALSAARDGASKLVCVGTSKGDLEVRDYSTGAKESVKTKSTERSILSLTWSGDGNRFMCRGSSDRLNLFSITASDSDRSQPYWKTEFVKTIKLPFDPDGVKQILLSPDGSFLLLSFRGTAQLWSLKSFEQVSAVQLRETTRWVEHPATKSQVLAVTPTTIAAHTWDRLTELQKYHISMAPTPTPVRSTPLPAVEVNEVKDSPQPPDVGNQREEEDEGEELIAVTLTHSKSHLIIIFSQQTSTQKPKRRRFVILDVSSLHSRASKTENLVPQIPLLSITGHLERPLDVLGEDTLVYVDRGFWVCSVRLQELLEPAESSPLPLSPKVEESRDAKENQEYTQEQKGKKNKSPEKRHFFIPRDWITTETLELLHLAADGTIVLPRHGEVIVIRSTTQ